MPPSSSSLEQGDGSSSGPDGVVAVANHRRPFLVLFRSLTTGTHEHELDSPSFFNIAEISCVVDLCVSLLRSEDVHVVPQDIGIIGAFRAQVSVLLLLYSIRSFLHAGDGSDVEAAVCVNNL